MKILGWPVKLRRSSGDDILEGRRGVMSLSEQLSFGERVESRRGRLTVPGVPGVPTAGLRSCLLGLQPLVAGVVGDAVELRSAAKRVRSTLGIAEKVLMSFNVSSMLRVISVSSPESCSLVSGLSCMIVLIPSSPEVRCIAVPSGSAPFFLGDSTLCVNPSLEQTVDSEEGERGHSLLFSTDASLRGDTELIGLGAPLVEVPLAAPW